MKFVQMRYRAFWITLLRILFARDTFSKSTLNISISSKLLACVNIAKVENTKSDSVSTTSIFNIENNVVSSILSIIKNEPGELLQTCQRVEDSLINVILTYKRSVPPNPLKLASFYNIRLHDGATEIEMREAMPLELMNVNNNLSIMYEGSHLVYPKIIHVNDTLASASGKFFLKRKPENTNFLIYEVRLKNRQIIRKEIINVNGQELEAYIHTYSIKIDVKFENSDYLSRTEDVQEWLVPKYGIVKQERKGNEINHGNAVNKNLECFRTQLIKSLNITK